MRLGIQMLDCAGYVNSIKLVRQTELRQGDSLSLYFMLVNLETGLRYVAASGALLSVNIPRSRVEQGRITDQRCIHNPGITRAAVQPFVGDASIWTMPLTQTDTKSMVSGGIIVTLSEGSKITKAALDMSLLVHSSGIV
jgi:hypothetical protein